MTSCCFGDENPAWPEFPLSLDRNSCHHFWAAYLYKAHPCSPASSSEGCNLTFFLSLHYSPFLPTKSNFFLLSPNTSADSQLQCYFPGDFSPCYQAGWGFCWTRQWNTVAFLLCRNKKFYLGTILPFPSQVLKTMLVCLFRCHTFWGILRQRGGKRKQRRNPGSEEWGTSR